MNPHENLIYKKRGGDMSLFNPLVFAFIIATFCIGFPDLITPSVFAESESTSSCYQRFPEWDQALQVEASLRKAEGIDPYFKSHHLELFSNLKTTHDAYYYGTASLCAERADYYDKLRAYESDLAAYEDQVSAHNSEAAKHNAQCSVIDTIEEQQSCQSWANQINNNKAILDNWGSKITSQKNQLDNKGLSINRKGDEINTDWRARLSRFVTDVIAGMPTHKEIDRMVAILTDSPARFVVADSNVHANPNPMRSIKYFEQVTENADRIKEASARHKVDPDLVRAIIWMESTRGQYDKVTGLVLEPKSILPMNIYAGYWTGFKVTREGLHDAAINIDTGTKLLARIQAKTSGGSIAKIATLYANLAAQQETEYGKTVEYYYNTKPWLKPPNKP
jgi:hypothetical protein